MIVSAVYGSFVVLLGCLMVLTRHLGVQGRRAPGAAARERSASPPGQPGRYQPGDRLWLAALSRLIPRRQWGEVFAVALVHVLAWHRRLAAGKWDGTRAAAVPDGHPRQQRSASSYSCEVPELVQTI